MPLLFGISPTAPCPLHVDHLFSAIAPVVRLRGAFIHRTSAPYTTSVLFSPAPRPTRLGLRCFAYCAFSSAKLPPRRPLLCFFLNLGRRSSATAPGLRRTCAAPPSRARPLRPPLLCHMFSALHPPNLGHKSSATCPPSRLSPLCLLFFSSYTAPPPPRFRRSFLRRASAATTPALPSLETLPP